MAASRSMRQWFDEYGESHRNATNILIHWICVPAILFSVIALLAAIPAIDLPHLSFSWAKLLIVVAVLGFYLPRSWPLALGMLLVSLLFLYLAGWIGRNAGWPLWAIGLVVFTAAWIGQFYGHKVEGKKPSFLKDLAFLLVGPAWLLAKIYRRLGIPW